MLGRLFVAAMPTMLAMPMLAATPGSPLPQEWSERILRLEQAVQDESGEALRAALEQWRVLAREARSSPDHQALARYTAAYAAWRLTVLELAPEKERRPLLKEAERYLKEALRLTPEDAEVQALLGSVQGRQIGKSPFRAIRLGPRSAKALERAAHLAPENPRVALQQGLSAYYAPAAFGGGMEKAERLIRRARSLFETESADEAWPNWGRLDAELFLARVLLRRDDREGARKALDRALAIAPASPTALRERATLAD